MSPVPSLPESPDGARWSINRVGDKLRIQVYEDLSDEDACELTLSVRSMARAKR